MPFGPALTVLRRSTSMTLDEFATAYWKQRGGMAPGGARRAPDVMRSGALAVLRRMEAQGLVTIDTRTSGMFRDVSVSLTDAGRASGS